jgi:hypothetical protein
VGKLTCFTFMPSPVDRIVHDLARTFASAETDERERIRSSLAMRDFYTIISYARRMTVEALRQGDPSPALSGITALAMIDRERLDWRDLSWAAGLVSFALVTTSEDARRPFVEMASLAERGTAEVLLKHADSPTTNLRSWGFRVVETTDGPGLISDEGKRYEPTVDLIRLSENWANRIEEDGVWRVDEPAAGSNLPKVWLRRGYGQLDLALDSLLGCVSLRGYMPNSTSSIQSEQMLLTFVAQTTSAHGANTIGLAAGPSTNGSFVGFGLAHRTLCAVVISRSVVQGVQGLETTVSIERFRTVLRGLVEQA